MPKNLQQVVTDVTELVRDLEAANRRIAELEQEVRSLREDVAFSRTESEHLNNPYLRDRVTYRIGLKKITDGGYGFLKDHNIEFIYQLVKYDGDQILEHRKCGSSTLRYFESMLAALGLRFGLKLEGFVP